MFSRINHMLGHKTCLNKSKKTEVISSIFSDNNAVKLGFNHNGKHAKAWKLNYMLLNNEWVDNEIKEEIKRYLEKNENENNTTKNLWDTGKAILRGKFIALQGLAQEKVQINNLILHLK